MFGRGRWLHQLLGFGSCLIVMGCVANYDTPRQRYLDKIEEQYAQKRAQRAHIQSDLAVASGQRAIELQSQLQLVNEDLVLLARELDLPVSAPYAAPAAPALPVHANLPDNQLPAFTTAAKENLVRDFKDPEGARFRDTYVSNKRGSVLCGEVNGKNTYGAYTGYKRFIATTTRDFRFIESDALTDFAGKWHAYCQP